jgi:oxalate decarboxylase/phosphoglucose isomerase-like protein (cupin superfamily)
LELAGDPRLTTTLQWAGHWLRAARDEDRPAVCVAHAGDVVLVPSEWQHSTVNLEDAVVLWQGV